MEDGRLKIENLKDKTKEELLEFAQVVNARCEFLTQVNSNLELLCEQYRAKTLEFSIRVKDALGSNN